MRFSIENSFFNRSPSPATEKQGLGWKISVEDEHFKPRTKLSSENCFYCACGLGSRPPLRGVFREFFDLWALRDLLRVESCLIMMREVVQSYKVRAWVLQMALSALEDCGLQVVAFSKGRYGVWR